MITVIKPSISLDMLYFILPNNYINIS